MDTMMNKSRNDGDSFKINPHIPTGSLDLMWQAEPSPTTTTYKQNSTLFTSIGRARTCTANRRRLGFFDLPTEIRLQIYETVNQLHPVVQRQLALGYPAYYPKPYFLELVVRTPAKEIDESGDGKRDEDDEWTLIEFEDLGLGSAHSSKERKTGRSERKNLEASRATSGQATCSSSSSSSSRRLLSPHRPRGYIPHALLRTCRRLYREARCVPFYENEFVFATWFSTGSSTALAFISALKAWQWAAMSYVRLEIPLEDIDGSNKQRLANWEALCEKWAFGLRGLRLTIVHLPNLMTLSSGGSGGGVGDMVGERGALLEAICPAPGSVGACSARGSRADYRWIDAGLKKLEALRRLEVELKTTVLSDDQKLDWCEGLKGMLSRAVHSGKEHVEIVCVRAKVD